jgi:radical SAM protein with 4Fe4S-binding SPASM domain
MLATDLLVRGRYDLTYDQMPLRFQCLSFVKRWNLLKAGMNLLRRSLSPSNLPLHLHVELTNYCALRCPVCPTGARTLARHPRSLDVELFERLLEDVSPTLLTMTLWGWGEPLLHPRLRDILRLAFRYPFATFLSTSSQKLLDEAVLEALIEFPPTHLIVAIDGLTDETNSRFRVGARLKPLLAGVRRLADLKQSRCQTLPILHMRYIVMKHNQHEVPQLEQFASKHRFDVLTVRTLSLVDDLEHTHDELVPDLEELRAYEYKDGKRIHLDGFVCTQPFWFPAVYADGTVVACEQDYNARAPFGVLNKETRFRQIWSSPQARAVRKLIRDTPEALSFCRSCPFSDRVTEPCSVTRCSLNPAIPERISIS